MTVEGPVKKPGGGTGARAKGRRREGGGRWGRPGGGGGNPPISLRGRRRGLLRPGPCQSPSFACGVPAACPTEAWAVHWVWVLIAVTRIVVPPAADAAGVCGLKGRREGLCGASPRAPLPFGQGVCERRGPLSLPEEPLPKWGGGLGKGAPPPPPPAALRVAPPPPPCPQGQTAERGMRRDGGVGAA